MAATLSPTLVRPNGSHWLELGRTHSPEPFERENIYPICELTVRGQTVRASFEADRYLASVWYEDEQTSRDEMGGWRIILRDVRTPDDERPDCPHLGREATGIGPATRTRIREACEPLIREWLTSDDYTRSRQAAASAAVRRTADAPRDYTIRNARQTLARVRSELAEQDAARITEALDHLERAAEILAEQ